MNNKLFFAIGLAATLLQAPVTVSAQSSGTSQQNPLLMKSNLPFGAPDFSRIKESDYLPAIEAAIKIKRDNIQKIVDNKKKPTFQNTILAFEESGILLDRVCSVFFGLTNADKTPVLAEAEDKVMPLLTGLENEISFNQQLFERIKFVYDNEYAKLKGEDQRLTEEIYKSFVRSGALLSAEKMARMKEINSRISELQQQWGNLLPEATNHAVVWVDNREDLAGLSESDIAQCKKDAEMRGGKAPYCIVIINTTQQPILASLQNRALRRKVFEASIHRADGTNPQYNTFPIVTELARLRAEKGQIMGYANYADYSLENTMAKNSANVDNFLEQLIKEYAPKADAETKAIEEYARKTEGSDFQLQPYDRFYYSAKMKKLDVYDNIAFGLRLAKLSEEEIDERVTEMLEIVSLKGFENRRVTSLSGGQQQRVAIARALVNRPQVLLLDEPLGALDLRLRKDMQNELKNIQQRMGITFIYVTHDQEEALTMSDTIVVMNKGKIQQIGTPQDIYNEPKNAFVADFIGESNILDGVMLDDYLVKFFGRKFQCVDKGFAPNEPVDVVIRPEDVDIVPPEQGHLCGTVTSVTFKGVHYDTIVDFKGFKWLIQTTDYCPVDAYIGIRLNPEDIHIMHKSEYSGLYGDYSSYSAEYDEIADASEEEDDEE